MHNQRIGWSSVLLWVCALIGMPSQASQAPEAKAGASLHVVCTLGILGDLAKQIGGDQISVVVLSSSRQDPHFVEPRPTLMRQARAADVFLQVGLQLELWADKVIAGSGNARIQSGQAGHVIVSQGISTLELPSVLSRELGDVHPNGNPHIWLDPLNTKAMAANIARAFSSLDAPHAELYASNLSIFEKRIDEALFGPELLKKLGSRKLTRMARSGKLMAYLELRKFDGLLGGWLKRALPLRGKPLISYHKTFVYFAQRFGMQTPIEVEGKPGIAPTPRHKAAVLSLMRAQHVRALMQANYFERSASQILCAKSGAKLCLVPIDVGPGEVVHDIFELTDLLLGELLAAHDQGTK